MKYGYNCWSMQASIQGSIRQRSRRWGMVGVSEVVARSYVGMRRGRKDRDARRGLVREMEREQWLVGSERRRCCRLGSVGRAGCVYRRRGMCGCR